MAILQKPKFYSRSEIDQMTKKQVQAALDQYARPENPDDHGARIDRRKVQPWRDALWATQQKWQEARDKAAGIQLSMFDILPSEEKMSALDSGTQSQESLGLDFDSPLAVADDSLSAPSCRIEGESRIDPRSELSPEELQQMRALEAAGFSYVGAAEDFSSWENGDADAGVAPVPLVEARTVIEESAGGSAALVPRIEEGVGIVSALLAEIEPPAEVGAGDAAPELLAEPEPCIEGGGGAEPMPLSEVEPRIEESAGDAELEPPMKESAGVSDAAPELLAEPEPCIEGGAGAEPMPLSEVEPRIEESAGAHTQIELDLSGEVGAGDAAPNPRIEEGAGASDAESEAHIKKNAGLAPVPSAEPNLVLRETQLPEANSAGAEVDVTREPVKLSAKSDSTKYTGIQWTDRVWNPVTGCSKVSAGCAHCYAEALTRRFPANFPQGFKVTLHPDRLPQPKRWRKPSRIFVNSMSDLFHEEVPVEFLKQVFEVIHEMPRHIFQILTKRHERLVELANQLDWPQNLWMGVSVENRNYAHRVDYLRKIPAAVRFLSCEPLLGPLKLDLSGIHWVIAGGESGAKHRPMSVEWVRSIRDQCQEAGVPFFFKQVGGATPKAGGRLLDGRTWDEMPIDWEAHIRQWRITKKRQIPNREIAQGEILCQLGFSKSPGLRSPDSTFCDVDGWKLGYSCSRLDSSYAVLEAKSPGGAVFTSCLDISEEEPAAAAQQELENVRQALLAIDANSEQPHSRLARTPSNQLDKEGVERQGMVISFSHTVEGILSGKKTVTRRDWSATHAQKWLNAWDTGRIVHQAWDKMPFAGGQYLGSIRLTCRPYQERLSELPTDDIEKECLPGVLTKEELLAHSLFKGRDLVWVVRFEVLKEVAQEKSFRIATPVEDSAGATLGPPAEMEYSVEESAHVGDTALVLHIEKDVGVNDVVPQLTPTEIRNGQKTEGGRASPRKALTCLSLFAGIGGFELGLQQSAACDLVAVTEAVEINEKAQQVYNHHFKEVRLHGDIRRYTPIGTFDILCGGFPCANTSSAGNRTGLAGEQSGLWREYLRIVKQSKPKFVLVENPIGLIYRGLREVIDGLRMGGYSAELAVLSAAQFGAPHRRERIFLLAYRQEWESWVRELPPWEVTPYSPGSGFQGAGRKEQPLRLSGEETDPVPEERRAAKPGSMGMANGLPSWMGGIRAGGWWESSPPPADAGVPKQKDGGPQASVRREAIRLYGLSVCPQQAAQAWNRLAFVWGNRPAGVR